MCGTEEDAFDDEAVEVAQTSAAYAGVALANMHLYQAQRRVAEQLQTAMQSRAVIEQAKGVLMGQRGCGADEGLRRARPAAADQPQNPPRRAGDRGPGRARPERAAAPDL